MIAFDDLRIVNAKGNAFPFANEATEDWTPDGEEKDCDSYMSWKHWQLWHVYKWPERDLRAALCFVEPFQLRDPETGVLRWATKPERYHAVLLVDYEGKTYALDNRHPHPMEVDLFPYEWHKFWSHDLNAWEWAKDADRSYA